MIQTTETLPSEIADRDWFREFAAPDDWDSGAMPSTLGYGRDRLLEVGLRKPHDPSYILLRTSNLT
ncbi:MAG: hypothetical protein R3E09_14690 [Novosphingobium sp.]